MKLLFEIDFKDYNPNWNIVARPSARAIIIKNNKVFIAQNMIIMNFLVAELKKANQ